MEEEKEEEVRKMSQEKDVGRGGALVELSVSTGGLWVRIPL